MSQMVEIKDGNGYPLDRADFLTNYTNKQNFVSLLKLDFKAVLCPYDANITIVKTSLQVQDKPVTILVDDTDVFY